MAEYGQASHARAGRHARREDAIRRARAYLEAHLTEATPLEALAAIAGMSRFHFCRVFRRFIGLSPGEYLRRLRVEHACTLLRQGRSISHAAYSAGYADQSHFTRALRAATGMPPGRYARTVRGLHNATRALLRPSVTGS